MCGRYGLYDLTDADFLKDNSGYQFKPNYNVAPSQKMPVIVKESEKSLPKTMKWGIHRQIGKDIEKDIINTRSDKAFGRFWGKTVKTHRCLIPANGFYEWKKFDKDKIPYWIQMKDNRLFNFAGIYSENTSGEYTYSIMTTTPNAEMSAIHDRMPVILPKASEKLWLETDQEGQIEDLLSPLPDGSLILKQVSKEVNSPKNNYPSLLISDN